MPAAAWRCCVRTHRLTIVASAAIAINADAPAPTYMRFFTRPPVWGVRGIAESIERRGRDANPGAGYAEGWSSAS